MAEHGRDHQNSPEGEKSREVTEVQKRVDELLSQGIPPARQVVGETEDRVGGECGERDVHLRRLEWAAGNCHAADDVERVDQVQLEIRRPRQADLEHSFIVHQKIKKKKIIK